jgi:thioredoxin
MRAIVGSGVKRLRPYTVCGGHMSIFSTTDAQFQHDIIESTSPILVDFWAPWCKPCKAVATELEKLKEQYGKKLRIAKINVDENPLTARNLYIRSIPTIIFYPGKGEAPLSIVGATTAVELERRFRLPELVK